MQTGGVAQGDLGFQVRPESPSEADQKSEGPSLLIEVMGGEGWQGG